MFAHVRERTSAEFDAGYANAITPDVVARWETFFRERSAAVLAGGVPLTTLAYGSHERQRIDFFRAPHAAPDAPTLVAIHGGLWFLFDRWLMHFLVPAFTAAGVHVACPSYRLAPHVRLGEIVDDCRRAIAHLALNAGGLGIAAGRLSVLGHSAAGQLAAVMASTDWSTVDAQLPRALLRSWTGVSGFYDIEPFAQTHFQPLVQFPPEDYRAWNPSRLVRPGEPPALLVTGARESEWLHEMMTGYAALLAEAGNRVTLIDAAGECHFSVLAKMGESGSSLHAAVRDSLA